jgi:hypothetical protein
MRTLYSLRIQFVSILVCAAAATAALGCNDTSDDDLGFPPLAGTPGSAGRVGTAGMAGGTAGAQAAAGSGGTTGAAGAPAGAGAAGSAGSTTSAAGAGGAVAGAGGMSGGASGAGGEQGSAGSAGMAAGPEAECQAHIVAAGRTVGACEMCLCGMDKCQPEIAALMDDTKGNALVACTNTSHCTGQCCLCGAACSPIGTNFAMGPCAAETETAAGVTPGAGLGNAAMVMANCVVTGPADNSCARAVRLGDCAAMKCMTECGITACQ